MKKETENRIIILDARPLNALLDVVVPDMIDFIKADYVADNINFKTENLIKKTLVTKALCKLLSDKNDQSIEAMLPNNNIFDGFVELMDSIYFSKVYNAVDDLYPNLLRVSGNVEVLIDAMISGNNLIVSVDIMEM